MISIEEMMIGKGISRERLDEYARRDNHNGKKDKVNSLSCASGWDKIGEEFQYALAEVLSEIGLANMEELGINIHESQKRYLESEGRYDLFVAQTLLWKLLKPIYGREYQTREVVGLDDLYQKMIERLEVAK